jgi:putative hydrolases of HD superfamily
MNKLRYALLAPAVWNALEHEVRKGWVECGIENPETVAEHTIDLLRLGEEIATEAGLSEMDRADLLAMLEVHDWPEAIEGDQITKHGVDYAEEADERAEKFERERSAMETICVPLGEEGKSIMALWLRFEKGDDGVAALARELDKYQAIEKAYKYERSGQGPTRLGEEFIRYSPPMTHPSLISRVQRLR